MYPHFSSNHPKHIFNGLISTETIRYSRLSSTLDDYEFLLKLFTLRLTSLDYPLSLIHKYSFPFLTFTKHKQRLKRLGTNYRQPTIYYKTTYNKHARTDKIVQHIINKYRNKNIPKLTKSYCNSTKLHTILLTNKKLHSKITNL